jgi:hypothetical protein
MAISDYCRCDVLDTYFVFLRAQVLLGKLTLEREIKLIESAKHWIEERADSCEAYSSYLENWDEWENPWEGEKQERETDNS